MTRLLTFQVRESDVAVRGIVQLLSIIGVKLEVGKNLCVGDPSCLLLTAKCFFFLHFLRNARFAYNPKTVVTVTGKPNIADRIEGDVSEAMEMLSSTAKSPKEKYGAPLTASQEYGAENICVTDFPRPTIALSAISTCSMLSM